jgi:hypothetical protein
LNTESYQFKQNAVVHEDHKDANDKDENPDNASYTVDKNDEHSNLLVNDDYEQTESGDEYDMNSVRDFEYISNDNINKEKFQ